ncbi:MAG: hypothetical protein QMD65_01995 [Patescibacteria group bacterium]|nr:hypothetical protein [Patescibacteria group bacterium]
MTPQEQEKYNRLNLYNSPTYVGPAAQLPPGPTPVSPFNLQGRLDPISPLTGKRASETPGTSPYQDPYYSRAGRYTPSIAPEKTPQQLDQEARGMAMEGQQERITAIQSYYNQKLSEELGVQSDISRRAEARTSALSSLMGLAGSSAAESRQAEQQGISQSASANISSRINTQMQMEIQGVYSQAEKNAIEYYKLLQAQDITNRQEKLKRVADNAMSVFQNYASAAGQAGKTIDFDEFLRVHQNDPDIQANLKAAQEAGITLYGLRQKWSEAIPEAYRPIVNEWKTRKGAGGNAEMYRITYNPSTKKMSEESYDVGTPFERYVEGKNVNVPDVGLVQLMPDNSYKVIVPNVLKPQKTQAEIENLEARTRKIIEGKKDGKGKEKFLTIWEISEFRRNYDWTPPYGFTESQLFQFMKDNPTATPEQLEAGAKKASAQLQGVEFKEPKRYLSEEWFRQNFTNAELKAMSNKLGTSKWWSPATWDINRFLTEAMKKVEDAKQQGYSDDEILRYLAI